MHIYQLLSSQVKKLLYLCHEKFTVNSKLNFLFLPDETPIFFLNEIPRDCNVLLVSSRPIVYFWSKFCEYHNKNHIPTYIIENIIQKINLYSSERQIIDYLSKPLDLRQFHKISRNIDQNIVYTSKEHFQKIYYENPLLQEMNQDKHI